MDHEKLPISLRTMEGQMLSVRLIDNIRSQDIQLTKIIDVKKQIASLNEDG